MHRWWPPGGPLTDDTTWTACKTLPGLQPSKFTNSRRQRSWCGTLGLLPPTSRCLLFFFSTPIPTRPLHTAQSLPSFLLRARHDRPRIQSRELTPVVTGAGRRSFHKSSYVIHFDNLATLCWAESASCPSVCVGSLQVLRLPKTCT